MRQIEHAGCRVAYDVRGTGPHVEFPDASHGLPIQFPGRVNALLLEHFARVAA